MLMVSSASIQPAQQIDEVCAIPQSSRVRAGDADTAIIMSSRNPDPYLVRLIETAASYV